MSTDQLGSLLVFAGLAFLVVGGGLGVVFFRNVFHAAVSMAFAFLGVAGIYFSLQADFLGVIQVLIYIGAVAVIIAFAIMLTRRGDMAETNRFVSPGQLALGALTAAGLWVALLGLGLSQWPGQPAQAPPLPAGTDLTLSLGQLLLSQMALPFEIAAVLLLVALVGAVLIAREDHPGQGRREQPGEVGKS
ncbi:MAG: NADH-quinone oxidoreductase subunit J [Firmicutes bacterium]|nr:NADH-quinone oxidoreductase subunit J [Bacillota bacterium]